jgi:hypothetical protein
VPQPKGEADALMGQADADVDLNEMLYSEFVDKAQSSTDKAPKVTVPISKLNPPAVVMKSPINS